MDRPGADYAQQPVRNRARRQDVYDLHLLLTQSEPMDFDDQRRLLHILRESCRARDIEPSAASLADPRVKELAREEYSNLAAEIEGLLPPFEEAFQVVQTFYEGLPWAE